MTTIKGDVKLKHGDEFFIHWGLGRSKEYRRVEGTNVVNDLGEVQGAIDSAVYQRYPLEFINRAPQPAVSTRVNSARNALGELLNTVEQEQDMIYSRLTALERQADMLAAALDELDRYEA